MEAALFLETAKAVLLDKRVIGTAVAVFLFMSFGVFVANYVKKPARKKVKRAPSAKKESAKKETASKEEGDGEKDSEAQKSS